MIELSDVAEYLGKRYGGWSFLGEKYGKRDKTNNWIGMPFGGSDRPDRLSPVGGEGSRLRRASRTITPSYLKLCQALKKINKPAGFALGNAVGDGNGFANWLIWSHGGYLRRRGRQGRDQQQGDDRGAQLSEGALSDLHQRHARLGRSQQQPRLCGGRDAG